METGLIHELQTYKKDRTPENYKSLYRAFKSKGFVLSEDDYQKLLDNDIVTIPVIGEMATVTAFLYGGYDSVLRGLRKLEFKAITTRQECLSELFNEEYLYAVSLIEDDIYHNAPEKYRQQALDIIATYKRLYQVTTVSTKENDIRDMVRASCMVLLLKKVFEMKVDEGLYKSLDFSSLIRLAIISGGKTIQIPTYAEVMEYIAVSYYYYLVEFEGKTSDTARKQITSELGIDTKGMKLARLHKFLAHAMAKEKDKPTKPIDDHFQELLVFINKSQELLKDKIANNDDPESIADTYIAINDSVMKLFLALK